MPEQWYVVTERTAKERERGREEAVRTWHVSGPFATPDAAHQAAVTCLAVFTCLSALVLSSDQIVAVLDSDSANEDMMRPMARAIDWCSVPEQPDA